MHIQIHDDVAEFIENLTEGTIAKVLRTIDLLEKFGNTLGMPHSKAIEDGIFELRIRGIQEVRLLYVFHKRTAILLHGFMKKQNTILRKDLNIAKRRRIEFGGT